MKTLKVLSATCVVAGLMMAPSAFAEDMKTSVGLGVGMAPDYEGSSDHEAVVLPFAKVTWGNEGHYVLLNGNNVRLNLLSEQWQLGPVLQFRKKRDDVDNDAVDRMKKVDSAVEGGLFLAYKSGPWSAGADYVLDISDEHDGSLLTMRGAYTCENIMDNLKLTTALSTTYADSDYMKTYFQVDASNVGTSGLRFRDADSGFKDVGISFVGDYSLNQNWTVRGIASYTQLLDDAKDSPVVDDEGDDGQHFLGLMGIYHFN